MGLNALDLAVILAYLLGVTAFGLRFRKHRRTLKDYFLADRQIPWWAISLSIVAAETSTLTIISVLDSPTKPTSAFSNWCWVIWWGAR